MFDAASRQFNRRISSTAASTTVSITHRFDAPLSDMVTATGDHTSDFPDAIIGAKIRFASETASRPAIAVKFSTRLPNEGNESGLGLDTMDFNFGLALAKTIQSVRVVGNFGFGILGDPVRGDVQNDVPTTAGPLRERSLPAPSWSRRSTGGSTPAPARRRSAQRAGRSCGSVRASPEVRSGWMGRFSRALRSEIRPGASPPALPGSSRHLPCSRSWELPSFLASKLRWWGPPRTSRCLIRATTHHPLAMQPGRR